MSDASAKVIELAQKLGYAPSLLTHRRLAYRRKYGELGDRKLERDLAAIWREVRDEPRLLRAGALPSETVRQPLTAPRQVALGRGRTGIAREAGTPKRRRRRKRRAGLTMVEINRAAEESAYEHRRDVLDAGEAPPRRFVEEITARIREVEDVVNGEEIAKQEARRRAERLRQAELELRRKGKSADEHAKRIDEAIDAMQDEARR